MNANDLVPLETQCEWRRDSLGDSYVFELTDAHRAELDDALVYAEAHSDDVLAITRDLFPLPTLGGELQRITTDLIDGRGVVLIRGVLAPGYRADVNVIDFERLTAHRPEMQRDLPAGGKRLVQGADGYVATIVAGEVTYEHGEAKGPLPGRLVRGPQPAPANGARR